MLKSYLDQLHEQADDLGIPLLKIFIKAGVPTSTYYRTIGGKTQLSYDTAMKVQVMIDGLNGKRIPKRKL